MDQNKNRAPAGENGGRQDDEKTREGRALTHEDRGEEEFVAEPDQKKKVKAAPTFVSGILKSVVYITAVVVISFFLAFVIISVGNDVFALVKSDEVVEVVIPEKATISDIADILGDAGVVKYPSVFSVYGKLKKKSEFVAGTYQVSTAMNYDELLGKFRAAIVRKVVRITIPEGYTVNNIIDLFLAEGIGTREGFVAAINDFDYTEYFPFLKPLYDEPNEDRYYRLEGYLYPDTYDIYSDSKESQIVYKLLENFEQKFSTEMINDAAEVGYTMDETLILASLIQKEAYYYEDYETVSSVFRNRLKNKSAFPRLESDATVTYAIELLTGKNHEGEVTGEDLEVDSPYNTRKYAGLTPGPICNPGYDAIMCALYPANTNYYYFVADNDGYNVYSKTLDEHQHAVERIRREKAEAAEG